MTFACGLGWCNKRLLGIATRPASSVVCTRDALSNNFPLFVWGFHHQWFTPFTLLPLAIINLHQNVPSYGPHGDRLSLRFPPSQAAPGCTPQGDARNPIRFYCIAFFFLIIPVKTRRKATEIFPGQPTDKRFLHASNRNQLCSDFWLFFFMYHKIRPHSYCW